MTLSIAARAAATNGQLLAQQDVDATSDEHPLPQQDGQGRRQILATCVVVVFFRLCNHREVGDALGVALSLQHRLRQLHDVRQNRRLLEPQRRQQLDALHVQPAAAGRALNLCEHLLLVGEVGAHRALHVGDHGQPALGAQRPGELRPTYRAPQLRNVVFGARGDAAQLGDGALQPAQVGVRLRQQRAQLAAGGSRQQPSALRLQRHQRASHCTDARGALRRGGGPCARRAGEVGDQRRQMEVERHWVPGGHPIAQRRRSRRNTKLNHTALLPPVRGWAMATRAPKSRGKQLLRMGVLYAASFASLLAGAHLVHLTMQPDMQLPAMDADDAAAARAPEEGKEARGKLCPAKSDAGKSGD